MEHAYREQKAKTVEQRTLAPTNQSQSIVDNRPAAIAQRKLIAGMHNVVQFNYLRFAQIDQGVKKLEADLISESSDTRYDINGLREYSDAFKVYLLEINKMAEDPSYKNSIRVNLLKMRIGKNMGQLNFNIYLTHITTMVDAMEADITSIPMNIGIGVLQKYSDSFRRYLLRINKIAEYPRGKNSISMRLLEIRIKKMLVQIQQKFSQLSIERYAQTTQAPNNYDCWFLSVFEGLRRSGLLIEIFLNNNQSDWQSKLQALFNTEYEKIIKEIESSFGRKLPRKKGMPNQKHVTKSFESFFKLHLPQYKYSLNQENSSDTGAKRKFLPKSPVLGSGIHISEDASVIYFYTVDKPHHAMFYIGIDKDDVTVTVYNQAKPDDKKHKIKTISRIEKHTFTRIP